MHEPTFTASDIALVAEHFANEQGTIRATDAALEAADKLKDRGDTTGSHIWLAIAMWALRKTPDGNALQPIVRWWRDHRADISETLLEALQDAATHNPDLRLAAPGLLKARPWQDLTDAENATVAALWCKLQSQIPTPFRPEVKA